MPRPNDIQPIQSIAILPFVNMSANPENEYFSDGLTEEIINALAKVHGLKVTARTSSFSFKNKNMDVREIGNQLGVATILEGSVRTSRNKVRITAQLVSVEDGFHFWSETFDRLMDDIFAVQDEISLLIAEKLRENSGHFDIEDHLVEAPNVSVEAYKLYLKGKYLLQKYNKDDSEKALAIFQKVIGRHPNWVLPYLGAQAIYTFFGAIGYMPGAEAFVKGRQFLDKAIELDINHPECQFQLSGISFWQHWDLEKAYQHLRNVLDISPGFANAYQVMGAVYCTKGEYDKAVKHLEISLQLDPFSAFNHNYMGTVRFYQGNGEEAILYYNKSLSIDPGFMLSKIMKGAALMSMGRLSESLDYHKSLPPETDVDLAKSGGIAITYAMQGNIKKAEEGIRKLEAALETNIMERVLFILIFIHANLGNYQKALDMIEQGINNKLPIMILLKGHPFLNPLRSMPQFKELMQRIIRKKEKLNFPKKKYKKSTLKKEDAHLYYEKLEKCMQKEKPFLDPTLTLRMLAEMINIHPNYLSQILNEKVGKNFSEFINSHRLEIFKAKAEDPANHHLTILALAYDSGFNSKTVFNTFFKKTMGGDAEGILEGNYELMKKFFINQIIRFFNNFWFLLCPTRADVMNVGL